MMTLACEVGVRAGLGSVCQCQNVQNTESHYAS